MVVKSTRGAMTPLYEKRKGGLWESKSFISKCQLVNAYFPTCALNESIHLH